MLAAGTGSLAAADAQPSVGIVNFATCISDSKTGKQEQTAFESLKKQLGTTLEETEKQLKEISDKFSDKEYLDGLSPEAEEQMKIKFNTLNEEMNRYQNQYYQVLNQANMRIIQTMGQQIAGASEKIAKEKKLTVILNKEACFFYSPQLDITSLVVTEMDKSFKEEVKTISAPAPSAAKSDAKVERNETKKK